MVEVMGTWSLLCRRICDRLMADSGGSPWMTLMWWLWDISAQFGSSTGLLGQVYPLEWCAAKSNSPGSQACFGVWILQWWLLPLNKKLNCCCVYDCLASCMPTNACDCCYCVLGFGSPLSLTGTVAVIDVYIMMLLLLPILVWGYGFEIKEWTNAI